MGPGRDGLESAPNPSRCCNFLSQARLSRRICAHTRSATRRTGELIHELRGQLNPVFASTACASTVCALGLRSLTMFSSETHLTLQPQAVTLFICEPVWMALTGLLRELQDYDEILASELRESASFGRVDVRETLLQMERSLRSLKSQLGSVPAEQRTQISNRCKDFERHLQGHRQSLERRSHDVSRTRLFNGETCRTLHECQSSLAFNIK